MIEGRDFAAASTIGRRIRQEDDWGIHINPPAREVGARLLAAVTDGIGGMPAGDQASGLALRGFLDSYRALDLPASERLRHSLAHANREVGIAAEADPELEGMGCTLVAVLLFADRYEWLSVGDSLILFIRDGHLSRVNPLHIYANKLDERVRRGKLSEDGARMHPNRAALTSAIQGTVLEEVAQGTFAVEPGDLLILASDGILTLTDDEIVSICAEHAEHGAQFIAQTIIEGIDAAARPSQDNATLVVVRHEVATSDQTLQLDGARQVSTAGKKEAVLRESSGRRVRDLVENEHHEPKAPTASAAAAMETEIQGMSVEEDREARRIAGTARIQMHGRTLHLIVRLFWLAAAFVLGALCGVIGSRIF